MSLKKIKQQQNGNYKYALAAVIIAGLIAYIIYSREAGPETDLQKGSGSTLTPVGAISHGHGLSIDVSDPTKLYIATHNGLLVLTNDTELYRIGDSQDDLMGFSPHPNTAKLFFSSGHPEKGGNIGFQRSSDGGLTWDVVSSGANGPVDLHAMAISPADPDLIYGWYTGALQRSGDGGITWEILNSGLSEVLSLTADSASEEAVFASTMGGLMVSKDKGLSWDNAASDLTGAVVTVLTIDPQDSSKLFSWSDKLGLATSKDKGSTWTAVPERFDGEAILYLAASGKEPGLYYAMTQKNTIYRSTDGAESWRKIR